MEIGMRSIAAKNLLDALEQARGVGLVEESFTLKGTTAERDCALVVRNLTPDEYEIIMEECKAYEEMAYLNAFQRGHVSRAIVEINGFDLREVGFIEDEIEDPKKPGTSKKIRLERHKWIEDNLIRTWSKEALFTVYRKVSDAVAKAEALAKEGVTFMVAEEPPHDRIRVLLAEVKELAAEMPDEMVDHIYGDYDLQRKTPQKSYEAAAERLGSLPVEVPAEAPEDGPVAPLVAPQRAPAVEVAPPDPAPAKPHQEAPEAILRKRTPLNQLPQEPPPEPPPEVKGRAAEYAALMDSHTALGLDMGTVPNIPPEQRPQRPQRTDIPEVGQRAKMDPKAALGIIDQPPPAGINPRFRPPGR
jgi:hypothetical protein